jgi:hypothetical protein
MSLMAPPHATIHVHSYTSTFIGVGLVVMGSIAVFLATIFHHRFMARLAPEDRPREGSYLSMTVAMGICAAGTILAIYLAASS